MLLTNRPVATVRKTPARSSLPWACSLTLMALLALGLTVPAVAQDSPSTTLNSSDLSRWHTPKDHPALQTASNLLPTTAPTIQDAFVANAVARPGGGGGGQVGRAVTPGVYMAIRLGAMVSPRVKFVGGLDATFPRLTLIPGLTTRVDLDAVVSANFGGITTIVPLTLDQVYSRGLASGTRVFVGAGIGPYFGEVTRFGGKLFVGANFTRRLGAEVDVDFSGSGDPLLVLLARGQF